MTETILRLKIERDEARKMIANANATTNLTQKERQKICNFYRGKRCGLTYAIELLLLRDNPSGA